MRPNAIEVIRGLQTTLATSIGPEVHSLYGQAEVQNAVMLLESLASEWETAAQALVEDNRELTGILRRGMDVIAALPDKGDDLKGLESSIATALAGAAQQEENFAISALTARNNDLRSLLERLLVACEDAVGKPTLEPLMAVRREGYQHLRRAATRGWSFWDTFSFRERMAQERGSGGVG